MLPPWVRYRFPEIPTLIKYLRETPCGDAKCVFCKQNHDPDRQLQCFFGYPSFRETPQTQKGESLQRAIAHRLAHRRALAEERAEGRARWLHHFDLYRPMVTDGSWAWIALRDTALFHAKLPAELTASLFGNDAIYLVLANYGHAPVEIATTAAYVPLTAAPSAARSRFKLEGRSLQILRRSAATASST